MTVLVAVRTGSAVVFAADSKLTTQSFVGRDTNGDPLFLPQTYDNATKLGHDRNKTFMAAVAGSASAGEQGILDMLSQALGFSDDASQDSYIYGQIANIGISRFNFWTQVLPPNQWPTTVILIATTSPTTSRPRLWRVCFTEDRCEMDEILGQPWIWLEGACDESFSLLYGWHPKFQEDVRLQLSLTDVAMSQALDSLTKPIQKINLAAMPLQDAIDLAYFLAEVQIEMDRFLPGTPLCGGPVDLMVLQGVPSRDISTFWGKSLTHPRHPRQ